MGQRMPGGHGGLVRWIMVGLWVAMAGEGLAQSAVIAKPEFDVASVRQNKSDDKPTSTFSLDNGNVYSTVKKGEVFTPGGWLFLCDEPTSVALHFVRLQPVGDAGAGAAVQLFFGAFEQDSGVGVGKFRCLG